MMLLDNLIDLYAEMNTMQKYDAQIAYNEGAIDKFDLLDAYLESEGIFGYGYVFRELFELLEQL